MIILIKSYLIVLCLSAVVMVILVCIAPIAEEEHALRLNRNGGQK